MKKRIGITAVLLAAGILTAASGCSSYSQNVVYLSSNWYANTGYKKFQPTFTEGNANFKPEKIVYDVKHDKTAAANSTYSVDYADGTYVTEFYAKSFSKNSELVHADYKDGYPEKDFTVYYYKTELKIPSVTFKAGGEEKTFGEGESVVCESYFLSVEDKLRPLYSYEKINSVSPSTYQVSSLDEAYTQLNYEYKTYYSYDGAEAKTVINDGTNVTEKTVYGLNSTDNTLFDVSYLDIAARACKLSVNLSQAVSLYTPNGGARNYVLTGSAEKLSDEERTHAESVLKNAGLYTPEYEKDAEGNDKEKGLSSVALSVTYSADLTGVSQTYWFASIDNSRNNAGRATMVKAVYPVVFGLGARVYTLNSVESTLWTD